MMAGKKDAGCQASVEHYDQDTQIEQDDFIREAEKAKANTILKQLAVEAISSNIKSNLMRKTSAINHERIDSLKADHEQDLQQKDAYHAEKLDKQQQQLQSLLSGLKNLGAQGGVLPEGLQLYSDVVSSMDNKEQSQSIEKTF